MSTPADDSFRWRPILLPAYGPTALASIGAGAIAPVVALTASELGAGVGLAAFVVGMAAFGQLLGDLPAGALAARVGEKRAMVAAGALDATAMLVAFLSRSLPVLAAAVFATGLAASVFNLARHSWMTSVIPVRYRARALSSLGGVFRVGLFIGPFVSAGVIAVWDIHAVYLFAATVSLGAAVLALTLPDLPDGPAAGRARAADPDGDHDQEKPARISIWRTAVAHRRVLLTLGVGILLLSAARSSRQSILPLWSQSQGLDSSTVSLIFGVASGVEILLVYPSGALMDRFGRVSTAVPAVLLMGLGLGLLPLTHTAGAILAVSCVMAVGSGLSSGIVLTLGSDVAPAVGRPQFLAGWRVFADTGALAGPALITVITTFATLAPAALALAALAFGGAGWLAVWVPRMTGGPPTTSHHPGP